MHRVHTIMVGRNLPIIYQRFPAKPDLCDPMPLLRLMLEADTEPIDGEVMQAPAEPVPRASASR